MMRVIIYEAGISRVGGRAFFDKKLFVGMCRLSFCTTAASSFTPPCMNRRVKIPLL